MKIRIPSRTYPGPFINPSASCYGGLSRANCWLCRVPDLRKINIHQLSGCMVNRDSLNSTCPQYYGPMPMLLCPHSANSFLVYILFVVLQRPTLWSRFRTVCVDPSRYSSKLSFKLVCIKTSLSTHQYRESVIISWYFRCSPTVFWSSRHITLVLKRFRSYEIALLHSPNIKWIFMFLCSLQRSMILHASTSDRWRCFSIFTWI